MSLTHGLEGALYVLGLSTICTAFWGCICFVSKKSPRPSPGAGISQRNDILVFGWKILAEIFNEVWWVVKVMKGNINLPSSADHEQDRQPYPVDPYSAICDDHAYILIISAIPVIGSTEPAGCKNGISIAGSYE